MADLPETRIEIGPAETPEAACSAKTDRLQKMLAQIWIKNEDSLQQRVEAVRRAYERLSGNTLDDQTRVDARDAAHKLAGVLGTFGLVRGTELAREAETLFDHPEALDSQSASRIGALLTELEVMLAAKTEQINRT